MSEEGESINENINLSSEKEAAPEVLDNESKIEESLRKQGEQLETSTIEQPSPSQLEVQVKPKKQKSKATINKIQKSLADTSNQIVKQRAQINKIKPPIAPRIQLISSLSHYQTRYPPPNLTKSGKKEEGKCGQNFADFFNVVIHFLLLLKQLYPSVITISLFNWVNAD